MEERILNIVKMIIEFPLKDVDTVAELLEHNEWGIALEHLCATLLEEDICISKIVYNEIQNISRSMELEPVEWEELEKLVK